MRVTSSQKVYANEILFIRGESQEERSVVPRFGPRLNTAESICRQDSRLLARRSTDRSSSHQGTQQGERLCQAVRAFHGSETPCNPESFRLGVRIAIHHGKLPFFHWLALSNANRAGRIAFANCFLDGKKFRLTMQTRAARHVVQPVLRILKYRNRR